MRTLYLAACAVALLFMPVAGAVQINFDLPSGVLNHNPPPDVGPPDSYHSGAIGFDPLVIEPGETQGIWVVFKDMLHLEVIDVPPNSDGVERLVTHINGRVVGQPGTVNFTDLWVDVTLSGTTGHIRETFRDPTSTHPDRPPLGQPGTGPGDQRGQNSSNDDPTGDWDGAYDDSGTDLWDLFHEDVRVDSESHAVVDGFLLETWADDLTDDQFLFHDIHWEITNHGPNPVEIFDVEFWQDGNVVRIGEWIPEPTSVALGLMGFAGLGLFVRMRRA